MSSQSICTAVAVTLAGAHAVPADMGWFDVSKPRAERVELLVSAMTLDEKLTQLVVDAPAIERLGVPKYHWRNNVLHGLVDNGISTQFPQAIGMAATFDGEQLRLAGRIMSDEQRAKHNTQNENRSDLDSRMNYGLNLWGPNINMFWNPVWGRGQETYGEDPFLTSTLTTGILTGLQQSGAVGTLPTTNALGEPMLEVGATCKHFVAYGVDKMPPRLSLMENISDWQLEQYFYPAWEVCADVASAVMCAYNGVNGFPMCISPLIASPLRTRFGFNGNHTATGTASGGGTVTTSHNDPDDDDHHHPQQQQEEEEEGQVQTEEDGNASPGAVFGRGQYVVTDSGALGFMVSQFHRFPNTTEVAAAALPAGIDLNSGLVLGGPLKSLFDAGDPRVTEGMLDQALTRLFHARMSFGLFDLQAAAEHDAPWMDKFIALNESDIMTAEHRQVALETAQRSMLLLKNDNALLPLTTSTTTISRDGKRGVIAVIGWGANDTYMQLGNYIGCEVDHNWGPVWANCSIVTPLQGIRNKFEPLNYTVRYSYGCDVESNDTSGFDAAVAAATGADLVVFVGGNRNCEGGQGVGGAHCESEGHDRPDLDMPGVQTDLLKRLVAVNASNVVLALTTGGVVGMDWEAANVPAILVTWYGGSEMGNALANLLAGDVSPSARSPLTWYADMTQVPASETQLDLTTPPGRTYRHFTGTPLYAFGFGLSYTHFKYANAVVNSDKNFPGNFSVCVTLSNEGARTAEEVVQVYAVPPRGVAEVAPLRMLVGLHRTSAMQATQTARICVSVQTSSLALVAKGASPPEKQVLPGKYEMFVGGVGPGALGRHVESTSAQAPLGPLDFVVA